MKEKYFNIKIVKDLSGIERVVMGLLITKPIIGMEKIKYKFDL
jgi:hypothetical protein